MAVLQMVAPRTAASQMALQKAAFPSMGPAFQVDMHLVARGTFPGGRVRHIVCADPVRAWGTL
jgi:hypothetical protein